MAFFKFRKDGAEPAAPAPAAESLEAMRKRARHRLIGAAALVLIGVIGFPLLFDSQPRPIDVDIVINIPEKNKVAPLAATPSVVAASQAEAPPPPAPAPVEKETLVTPAPVEKMIVPAVTAAPDKATAKAGTQTPAPVETKPDAKATAKTDTKTDTMSDAKPAVKADAKPIDNKSTTEAAKAQTLLEGKEPAPAPAPAPAASAPALRYVVQVGAFAEAQKAKEARQILEKAGISTYAQVADTKEGRRTRVRVGPFTNKADVDKAIEKIKALNLPTQVLTL